ncbi:MAG: hypothetical protein LC637_11670 [Xanthomonadaceae bacterium]|nr:hypothetical protein [Xanthomonadaceae bacterium]
MLVFSVLAASPVPAQIYRCVEGETTIFSDRPCSENVEIHQPAGRLSVIAVTSDLEAISARNRAFIDQRLNRMPGPRDLPGREPGFRNHWCHAPAFQAQFSRP